MEELLQYPSIKCLVFGKTDSGKTSFVYEYATKLLSELKDGICLIVARRSKAERKLVECGDCPYLNRILYKWATDSVSLIQIASRLHLFQDQELELLVVEDILEFVSPQQANFIISLFLNALTVFPNCRFIVTMTPKKDVRISNLRIPMTHYVNTYSDSRKIGVFPKSKAKAEREIDDCMSQIQE